MGQIKLLKKFLVLTNLKVIITFLLSSTYNLAYFS